MAVVSRRTVYLLLVALLLLSIVVRYPLVEHERNQADSYFIHGLSSSIRDNGYAKWTFSAFSYLGYYPFSYPSGMPFLLAEFSTLTGLNMESCILLVDFILASLFCLSCFVLSRQFLNRPEFVLLATLLVILGSRFVDTSYWNASARAPFVVLVSLVAFVSFRAGAMGQNRLFIIAGILVFGCMAMHHMAVLVALLGLGYLLAAFETHYLLGWFRLHKRWTAVVFNIAVSLVFGALIVGYLVRFEGLNLNELRQTSLFDINPPVLSIVLNLAASYTNQIGFILIFALVGIPSLFRSSRLSVETLFPIAVLIAFIPLLGNALYVSMVLSPFVAVLGTAWIAKLAATSRRKQVVISIVVVLIVSSAALPIWSTQRWNEREYLGGETVAVDCQVFNDGAYLRVQFGEAPAVSNVNSITAVLAATSHIIFLGSGISEVLGGDVTRQDVERNITWSEASFPRNLYVWFEYQQQANVNFYVLGLMIIGVSFVVGNQSFHSATEYYHSHPKFVVAVDNLRPSEYVDMYSVNHATFLTELKRSTSNANQQFSSYEFYQSEGLTLYLVQLPP